MILEFEEFTARKTLNTTAFRALRQAFGRDTARWIGKQVALDKAEQAYGGKMYDVLRVAVPATVSMLKQPKKVGA